MTHRGAILVSLVLTAAGCVDMSPDPAPTRDAEGVAIPAECTACIAAPAAPGPGCGEDLLECNRDAVCARAASCLATCYSPNRTAFVACLPGCAQEQGLSSLDDPAVLPGRRTFNCVVLTCASACFSTMQGGADASASPVEGGSRDSASPVEEKVDAGACSSALDEAWLRTDYGDEVRACGMQCFGQADMAQCIAPCLSAGGRVSFGCAYCSGLQTDCSVTNCLAACLDSTSSECIECSKTSCGAVFDDCAGAPGAE